MTHIVKVRAGATAHPELATLGQLLADGELVAFPTETVYGIAARSDRPGALKRLRDLKGRAPDRPFTVHLADAAELVPLIAPPDPFVERIIKRLWPGPLTLVLADRLGGHTGFRLPDCDIARALFRLAGVPLVATSANRSGEPPLVTGRHVVKSFKGLVAGILFAGKTTLATPSTVAFIEGRKITLLRPGVVPGERIQEAGCYQVLFVCTGNLCRSPMAEAMLRKALADRLHVPEWGLRNAGIHVHSAGIIGMRGCPPPPEAARALRPYGADLTHHFARPLTRDLIRVADVIYTAEREHADTIRKEVPEADGKILPLSADGTDLPDPYGGAERDYHLVARQIEKALKRMVERTISKYGPSPRF